MKKLQSISDKPDKDKGGIGIQVVCLSHCGSLASSGEEGEWKNAAI